MSDIPEKNIKINKAAVNMSSHRSNAGVPRGPVTKRQVAVF